MIYPTKMSRQEINDPKRPGWQTSPRRVIFLNCYADVHYAPYCSLRFREYRTIVLNYEKRNIGN